MFEHSIRVPRMHKTASIIAKKVKEEGASIKGLVYENKFWNTKGIYALVVETFKRQAEIDFLLKKSKLFEKEPRLDPWLTRILITELLWGKKQLPGESKPVKTILAYEQILKAHMTDIHEAEQTDKVQKLRFVRVNTLKLSLNEAVEGFRDEGWTFSRYMEGGDYVGFLERVASMSEEEFMVDIHVDNLLVFPVNTQFYKHRAYRDGQIMLQDKASCLPVQVLNPPPGSVVLDMCAAPGMKTTQLAAHLNNDGKIFAVEKDQNRVLTLNRMIESAGATCVTVLNKDVVTINDTDIPGVEYILIDPSCSGSGIVDRVELPNDHEQLEQRLNKLAGFQIKILKHALRSFPDAKRVVYSTCSIYSQENEDVISEVISSCTKFKLVPVQNLLKAPWLNFASKEEGTVGNHCIYARPEDDLTNGFFVAVFERLAEGEENVFLKQRRPRINIEREDKERMLEKKWNNNGDPSEYEEGNYDISQNNDEIIHNPSKVDSWKDNNNADIVSNARDAITDIENGGKKQKGSSYVVNESHERAAEDGSKKKNKKRRNLDQTTENMPADEGNIEESAEATVNAADELKKKRNKKKQRENLSEEVINEKQIDHQLDSTQEQCEVRKKKKKSVMDEVIHNDSSEVNLIGTDDSKKKRKKKKNQDNAEVAADEEVGLEEGNERLVAQDSNNEHCDVSKINSLGDEESLEVTLNGSSESKKKRKKRKNADNHEVINDEKVSMDDGVSTNEKCDVRKKNKTNHGANFEHADYIPVADTTSEENTNKKKKKNKAAIGDNIEHYENIPAASKSSEVNSKKKKKKNRGISENAENSGEGSQENPPEVILDETTGALEGCNDAGESLKKKNKKSKRKSTLDDANTGEDDVGSNEVPSNKVKKSNREMC